MDDSQDVFGFGGGISSPLPVTQVVEAAEEPLGVEAPPTQTIVDQWAWLNRPEIAGEELEEWTEEQWCPWPDMPSMGENEFENWAMASCRSPPHPGFGNIGNSCYVASVLPYKLLVEPFPVRCRRCCRSCCRPSIGKLSISKLVQHFLGCARACQ